jgi:hypothetical protein
MTFSKWFDCRRCHRTIRPHSKHYEVIPGEIWCNGCYTKHPSCFPCLIYADAADLWRELRIRTKQGRAPAAEYQPDRWEAMQDREASWHPFGPSPTHWRAS